MNPKLITEYLVFDRVESTQNEAKEWIKKIDRKDTASQIWVLARHQNSGRGRQGRVWESPTGNFHCSMAMRTSLTSSHVSLLPLVAGQSLFEALFTELDLNAKDFFLKWPNDLYFKKHSAGSSPLFLKVAGVLVESFDQNAFVVGWGVNVLEAPSHLRATSLQAEFSTQSPTLERLAVALRKRFLERWNNFTKNPEKESAALIHVLENQSMAPLWGEHGFYKTTLPAQALGLSPKGYLRLLVSDPKNPLNEPKMIEAKAGEFSFDFFCS